MWARYSEDVPVYQKWISTSRLSKANSTNRTDRQTWDVEFFSRVIKLPSLQYLHADLLIDIITQRCSVAKNVGCFQWNLIVCGFVNMITSEWVNVGWWNLAGRCNVQNLGRVRIWGSKPPPPGMCTPPKMWCHGHNVGKNSTGCLVFWNTYTMTFLDANSAGTGSRVTSAWPAPSIGRSPCSWSVITDVFGGRRQNEELRQKYQLLLLAPRPTSSVILVLIYFLVLAFQLFF